ncbi:hypothetical protein Pelo_15544 [Pelomyxa schiedti]|nr:hypothetical protein Pelo_15544 [Pelomyxa schiedti]
MARWNVDVTKCVDSTPPAGLTTRGQLGALATGATVVRCGGGSAMQRVMGRGHATSLVRVLWSDWVRPTIKLFIVEVSSSLQEVRHTLLFTVSPLLLSITCGPQLWAPRSHHNPGTWIDAGHRYARRESNPNDGTFLALRDVHSRSCTQVAVSGTTEIGTVFGYAVNSKWAAVVRYRQGPVMLTVAPLRTTSSRDHPASVVVEMPMAVVRESHLVRLFMDPSVDSEVAVTPFYQNKAVILVVDMEQTYKSKSLVLLSTTRCAFPLGHFASLVVLRNWDYGSQGYGSRTFIASTLLDYSLTELFHVEEGTGLTTHIARNGDYVTNLFRLSSSRFCVSFISEKFQGSFSIFHRDNVAQPLNLPVAQTNNTPHPKCYHRPQKFFTSAESGLIFKGFDSRIERHVAVPPPPPSEPGTSDNSSRKKRSCQVVDQNYSGMINVEAVISGGRQCATLLVAVSGCTQKRNKRGEATPATTKRGAKGVGGVRRAMVEDDSCDDGDAKALEKGEGGGGAGGGETVGDDGGKTRCWAGMLTQSLVRYIADNWLLDHSRRVVCNLRLLNRGTGLRGDLLCVVAWISSCLGVVGTPTVVPGNCIVGWIGPDHAACVDGLFMYCANFAGGSFLLIHDFVVTNLLSALSSVCTHSWVIIAFVSSVVMWKVVDNVCTEYKCFSVPKFSFTSMRMFPGSDDKLLVLGSSLTRLDLSVLDLTETHAKGAPQFIHREEIVMHSRHNESPPGPPSCFFISGVTENQVSVRVPIVIIAGKLSVTPCRIVKNNNRNRHPVEVSPSVTTVRACDDSHLCFTPSSDPHSLCICNVEHPFDGAVTHTIQSNFQVIFNSGMMFLLEDVTSSTTTRSSQQPASNHNRSKKKGGSVPLHTIKLIDPLTGTHILTIRVSQPCHFYHFSPS